MAIPANPGSSEQSPTELLKSQPCMLLPVAYPSQCALGYFLADAVAAHPVVLLFPLHHYDGSEDV